MCMAPIVQIPVDIAVHGMEGEVAPFSWTESNALDKSLFY